MRRRVFISLALSSAALPAAAAGPTPAQLLGVNAEPYFVDWLNDFYPRALAAGTPKAVLDRELSGLSADPRANASDARQPEFARPVSDYINGVMSAGRISLGIAKRSAIPQFPAIE